MIGKLVSKGAAQWHTAVRSVSTEHLYELWLLSYAHIDYVERERVLPVSHMDMGHVDIVERAVPVARSQGDSSTILVYYSCRNSGSPFQR